MLHFRKNGSKSETGISSESATVVMLPTLVTKKMALRNRALSTKASENTFH